MHGSDTGGGCDPVWYL